MPKLNALQLFLVYIIPVLFAITLHEVAHGWVASKLGDHSAKMMGRITLNPIKHLDLVGTVLLPGVLLLTTDFIFGWAKPVPINTSALRRPKTDMAWVALAGPGANFIMAIFWAALAHMAYQLQIEYLLLVGIAGIQINLILALINLIPIPPLDGSRVVSAFLPASYEFRYAKLEPYGFIILIVLLLLGMLEKILRPPMIFLIHLLGF